MNNAQADRMKNTYYQIDVRIKETKSASILSKNRFPVTEIAELMDNYFTGDAQDLQVDINEIKLTEKEFENLNHLNIPVYFLGQSGMTIN